MWRNSVSFPLSDEEKLTQESAQSFAEKEVKPLAVKIDKEHYFPKELIAKLAENGFMGSTVPVEYGGAGLSVVAYSILIEELAAACASTSVIVSAHTSLCITPILDSGSPEQKKTYLPDLAAGKTLGCFALSEPGTGSDAAAITCTYKKEGEDFIVNGTKNWITNAPEADVCILFATGDQSKGYKGVTAFVHRMDLPGIKVGKHEDKLGIRGSPTASINYENVKLTPANLLGAEGKGFGVAMNTLNGGRIGVASQAVGIARSAFDDALAYSKDRKTFGKPICEHQSVQNHIADMICRIDAARYLTLEAAKSKDLGLPYARKSAMAKLFASETAMFCADKGIQIHGGYGYVTEFPAERHLRDAKITEIYEGTSEIQRLVIASAIVKE